MNCSHCGRLLWMFNIRWRDGRSKLLTYIDFGQRYVCFQNGTYSLSVQFQVCSVNTGKMTISMKVNNVKIWYATINNWLMNAKKKWKNIIIFFFLSKNIRIWLSLFTYSLAHVHVVCALMNTRVVGRFHLHIHILD